MTTNTITRLSLVIVLNTFLFASSSNAQFTGSQGGSSEGKFISPRHEISGATLQNRLSVAFLIKENITPGYVYAESTYRTGRKSISFICILRHRLRDGIHSEFPYALRAESLSCSFENTVKIDESIVKINYSIKPGAVKKDGIIEALEICQLPVDLSRGRVFQIDMTESAPVITQYQCTIPDFINRQKETSSLQEIWDTVSSIPEEDSRVNKINKKE